MKKILVSLIIVASLFNCSKANQGEKSIEELIENGTLQELKQRRMEVAASYDSISNILTTLEKAINTKDTTKKYTLVTSYKVKDTTFKTHVSLQGSVETNENILIYPEYQGVLSKVYVKEGQRVSKDQILAKIEDGGLSSQLAQLQAQYDLSKTTFERQERLWQQKIGSEIQYLQAKTNMESAEKAVEQLKSQLAKTTIKAPFSGVIDDIITEQGQVVAPGMQAIMRLVNLDDMYVKSSVPENYLTSITKGSKVMVTFPALETTIEGLVNTVGNYINPRNRTFEIEVKIPNQEHKIKPNLMANLDIVNYTKEGALVVPSDAIQENSSGQKFVFALDKTENNNFRAKKIEIEIGDNNNGMVEVVSGLDKGIEIVKDGALTLKDGEIVTVKTNQ